MTTTMLYTTGASMDEPTNRFANKTNSSGKPRHRPKSIQIEPFDPNELSKKLTGLAVEQDGQPSQQNQLQVPMSANDMGEPSPRTIPAQQPTSSTTSATPKSHKEKKNDKLGTPTQAAPSRRGSIFDHLRFRGSNYTDETERQEEEDAKKKVRYRHVPQVAAQQFARTTTVEPLAQKAQPSPQGMRSVPGPHSMNNGTMSLQEYNRQYRRAQSLCSGRPSGPPGRTRLESTAEVDEENSQQKNPRISVQGQFWNDLKAGEPGRRMSTGNMWGRSDSQLQVPFRRDSTAVGAVCQNNPTSGRRGSASSSGFSDVSSPFARDSGPASPFKTEFGGANSPNRQGSDNTSAAPSRRSSLAGIANPQRAAEVHRVDWSQSDQPAKVRRDSKWAGLKQRKASTSQKTNNEEKLSPPGTETGAQAQPSTSPKSPKVGFLGRFKR
ncbi:hypothetical protein N0V84_008530 [Fusarium piperis]|uniref:Uncharacterized protein n=1 Tax=Fusarium piperis TaxID=1435070 RepID=A0A9W8W817_9HYPO|nr:hypothetical protein N0V84_008530 [Fusarium piperis]